MENFGPGTKTSANPKAAHKMSRIQALVSAQTSSPILERSSEALVKVAPISDYFGCNTFGLSQMREKLPKDAFSSLLLTLEKGTKLPKEAAEAIA
ncbi:MAG: glutamine synthetase III, partial [Bdellovibrio sp.]